MSIMLRIAEKIEQYEKQTGLTVNTVFVGRAENDEIKLRLKGHSSLINMYPTVFQKTIKILNFHTHLSVGFVI